MSLSEQFSKHRNINVGFELECFYDGEKLSFEEVCESLRKIHPDNTIGGDGSLVPSREQDYAIEIKTPILPAHQAICLLNNLFNWISKYGNTNATCGLHLNFSPKYEKLYNRFNPVLFANHPIWGTVGRYFRRNGNRYCFNHFANLKKMKTISQSISTTNLLFDKYSAISLRNWPKDRRPDSRIEVRIFGGKDYESEFKRIFFYTDKIFTLFKKSSQRDLTIFKL